MKSKKRIWLVSIAAFVLVIVAAASAIILDEAAVPQFKEPAVSPPGKPDYALFNPYINEYYDSRYVYWDQDTERYRPVQPTYTESTTPVTTNYYSTDDWVADHQNSTDEVERAFLKYVVAMDEYWKANPRFILRSDWVVGQEAGGPLTIITDLGISKVPQLLTYTEYDNPFTVVCKFAISSILRIEYGIGDIYRGEEGARIWKNAFDEKSKKGKMVVDNIVKSLDSSAPLSDEEIYNQLDEVGLFALPAMAGEIKDKANTRLLKYLHKVLPEEKIKQYEISATVYDEVKLQKALKSCDAAIRVINAVAAK